MAKRRMFSLDVVDTDNFLELPSSTQMLYFHLGMRADDDGFVSSPKRITATVGASPDDLRLLAAKGFLIVFDSGVCAIRDWRVNNYLRPDRYTPTLYQAEKAQLADRLSPGMTSGTPVDVPADVPAVDDEDGDLLPAGIPADVPADEDSDLLTGGIPADVPAVDTGKDRSGKDRSGKDRSGKGSSGKVNGADKPPPRPRFSPPSREEVAAYCRERGNRVDPQRFADYYEANGWKVGRNGMKDWKAAVRTWERRDEHVRRGDPGPGADAAQTRAICGVTRL